MNYTVLQFSAAQVYTELAFGSSIPEDAATNQRAQYVASYLQHIEAKTLIVEYDYVDADYLDDFSNYYVKSFAEITKRCRRLHFFRASSIQSSLIP